MSNPVTLREFSNSLALEMVLTSIVNNNNILNDIIEDIEIRFKTKIDKEKLVNYLSAIEPCVEGIYNV